MWSDLFCIPTIITLSSGEVLLYYFYLLSLIHPITGSLFGTADTNLHSYHKKTFKQLKWSCLNIVPKLTSSFCTCFHLYEVVSTEQRHGVGVLLLLLQQLSRQSLLMQQEALLLHNVWSADEWQGQVYLRDILQSTCHSTNICTFICRFYHALKDFHY